MLFQYPLKTSLLLSAILAVSACQLNTQPQVADSPVFTEEYKQSQQQLADTLIEEYSHWQISSSPMLQAYRGLKTNYGKWDDISDEYQLEQLNQEKEFLARINTITLSALEQQTALSLALLQDQIEQDIKHYEFRLLSFPVNQMYGLHSEIPNFLINIHQVSSIKDARYYIERVNGTSKLIEQLIEQLELREAKGIRPPRFVYDSVISASEGLISGYPIDSSKIHNIIWSDFLQKIEPLDLYDASGKVLKDQLKRALKRHYLPAYSKLIKHLKQGRELASSDTGLHQFEQGKEYYNLRLQAITTTTLSAEDIHQLGLNEIARIKATIIKLLPQLNQPSLEALFEFTRTEKSLYFESNQQALEKTKTYIKNMNRQLNRAFKDIPNIPMEVLEVESYREESAPVAFYQSPSDDGKRPGRYYMNGSKLNEMPAFQFEALAYHETIPGHHLQTIYAQQSKQIPEFRRHIHFTAYSEGWGLYAETLAKELGAYQDPWNEYGRLLMELWRANRLVIDTGLHYYGWDIDKALTFRLANTPFSEEDSLNAIKRYLVMPGQATAYKVGQLKFLELKTLAEHELGRKLNLPAYHAYILNLGPLPLTLLEKEVKAWIQRQKA
ncbi:MAG: hypothetical protein ACI8SR_001603 [Oceanicoccus sp.]|jgi:uncharacterized protein (DUF885 family)